MQLFANRKLLIEEEETLTMMASSSRPYQRPEAELSVNVKQNRDCAGDSLHMSKVQAWNFGISKSVYANGPERDVTLLDENNA